MRGGGRPPGTRLGKRRRTKRRAVAANSPRPGRVGCPQPRGRGDSPRSCLHTVDRHTLPEEDLRQRGMSGRHHLDRRRDHRPGRQCSSFPSSVVYIVEPGKPGPAQAGRPRLPPQLRALLPARWPAHRPKRSRATAPELGRWSFGEALLYFTDAARSCPGCGVAPASGRRRVPPPVGAQAFGDRGQHLQLTTGERGVGDILATVFYSLSNAQEWWPYAFDLLPHAGHSLELRLESITTEAQGRQPCTWTTHRW
jgi:hypothetical protein